jgi:hypothetical protein
MLVKNMQGLVKNVTAQIIVCEIKKLSLRGLYFKVLSESEGITPFFGQDYYHDRGDA